MTTYNPQQPSNLNTSGTNSPTTVSGATNASASTYNPQQPTNLNTSGTNSTTRFFNNYFIPNYTVSQNTNDAILSYFELQTGNIESAKLLAQAVIDTAQSQRADPLQVLSEFQKLPSSQLNTVLALYLNTGRVNTSLLGIKNYPKTSSYVSRTIIPV